MQKCHQLENRTHAHADRDEPLHRGNCKKCTAVCIIDGECHKKVVVKTATMEVVDGASGPARARAAASPVLWLRVQIRFPECYQNKEYGRHNDAYGHGHLAFGTRPDRRDLGAGLLGRGRCCRWRTRFVDLQQYGASGRVRSCYRNFRNRPLDDCDLDAILPFERPVWEKPTFKTWSRPTLSVYRPIPHLKDSGWLP